MIDPIIKAPRISPASFSLKFRGPNARQKFLPEPIGKEEVHPEKPVEQPAITPRQAQEPKFQQSFYPPPQSASVETPPPAPDPKATQEEEEQKQRQEALDKAHEAGRQKGVEEARADAKQELEQNLKQIGDLMASLKDLRETLLTEMEDGAVEIVFEAVTKIIGQTAIDRQIALNIVNEAIQQARGRSQLTVRVSPRDFEMVQAALSQAGATELAGKEVHVIPDNIVHLGGCVLETEAGNLDARLEIKLQRLKDTLLAVRKSESDA